MKDIIYAHSTHLTLEMNNHCFKFVNSNRSNERRQYCKK